jgi:L-ascorbate metabolism protein UlaG (beta-lactamase superfamily)
MEFQYYGANCIKITTKNAVFVVDDNLKELGLKSITKPENVALMTVLPTDQPDARLVITDPGEYEVSEVSIFGIAARAHMDEAGKKTATIYKLHYDDTKVCILGHVYPDLTEEQLEAIGMIDILITPVGGSGYTLDGVGALTLIKKIEPKLVIPTHYDDKAIKYEVPQASLEDALKNMAMEQKSEPVAKFKPKPADYGETTQLVVLERQ